MAERKQHISRAAVYKGKIHPHITFTPEMLKRNYDFMQELIDSLPEEIPSLSVSEYAEQHRILPRGTPYPGPWSNARTQYLRQIMDDLSANSKYDEVIFAKSAQVGATAGAIENWIAYIIACVPGPIMFCTANEALLGRWTHKRLTPLLISCGLESRFFAQHEMAGAKKRTGNTQHSKEFSGGSLEMVTAGSAANLRSDSIRYLIMDELDGYPAQVSGEGSPESIARARLKAWGDRAKSLFVSTPTTLEDSRIWPMYLSGGQHKYFVPCPMCGTFQELEFGGDEKQYGFKWETKSGVLDSLSIGYQCLNCRELIKESQKFEMVIKGEWRATAQTEAARRRSYHIWAAYSMLEKWDKIIQAHIDTEDDDDKRRAFVNTYLGLPYEPQGNRPKLVEVLNLTSSYDEWTIPDDVLFLTAAADVQQGSKRDRANPPRIELEVLGHGANYQTFSIGYKRIEGGVFELDDGAWAKLGQWIRDGGLKFKRRNGDEMNVQLFFIDSGDGNLSSVVYEFCKMFPGVFPCRGHSTVMRKIKGKDDEEQDADASRYNFTKLDEDLFLYVIKTNFYKKQLYRNLTIKPDAIGGKAGACYFPRQYEKDYFKMLQSEEQLANGSFHLPHGRRNEALDVRVYNLCAGHVYVDAVVRRLRETALEAAKKRGQSYTKAELLRINAKTAIDYLKQRVQR